MVLSLAHGRRRHCGRLRRCTTGRRCRRSGSRISPAARSTACSTTSTMSTRSTTPSSCAARCSWPVCAAAFDHYVIDAIVDGAATLTRGISWLNGLFDSYVVDGAVNGVATCDHWASARASGGCRPAASTDTSTSSSWRRGHPAGATDVTEASEVVLMSRVETRGRSARRQITRPTRVGAQTMSHVLTYMTFIPLAGWWRSLCLPRGAPRADQVDAVAATTPPLLMAIWLFANFDRTQAGFQFDRAGTPGSRRSSTSSTWSGVDGISITMVLLTALLCFICIFASWGIDKAVKGYFALFLLLDAGMMGVFVALDFFLFYIFWEVMLLPMYFLIGIWGGPRREYAAIKFFLYTLVGSVLMLLAMLGAVLFGNDPHTFDMTHADRQQQPATADHVPARGRGSRCSSASRSRSRCSRSTPGCPTRTSRRPRRSRSSWPACC